MNQTCLWCCSSARQCVSTLDRQTCRQGAGGGKPLHCTQESTCSALWECLDISSNGSMGKKKGKVILCALLQPAGAKQPAPIWHKQTHTVHTHTWSRDCTYTDSDTVTSLLVFIHTDTHLHMHSAGPIQFFLCTHLISMSLRTHTHRTSTAGHCINCCWSFGFTPVRVKAALIGVYVCTYVHILGSGY